MLLTFPFSPAWLAKLAEYLRQNVDVSPYGAIRLDLTELAALWACSRDEAETSLCDAAVNAELAVGVVDDIFCDVMTVDEAHAVLEASRSRSLPH